MEQHLALQRQLQTLGYLPKSAKLDGVYGEGTRAAIMSWQQSNGIEQTGFLDNNQAARLAQTATAAIQDSPPYSANESGAAATRDTDATSFWSGLAIVGAGLLIESTARAAADATHKCSVKAMVYAAIETVNGGFVDAGIEALSGDQANAGSSSHSQIQAIKFFVAGAMDDDGLHGYTKEAIIAATQQKFPNNPFAAAYVVNAIDAHDKCEAERPQSGDID